MDKDEERDHVRKLTRLGAHSYYVVIPPRMIRSLGWRERQRLRVDQKGDSVVIAEFKASRRER